MVCSSVRRPATIIEDHFARSCTAKNATHVHLAIEGDCSISLSVVLEINTKAQRNRPLSSAAELKGTG
jgi:hypothetical protein